MTTIQSFIRLEWEGTELGMTVCLNMKAIEYFVNRINIYQ